MGLLRAREMRTRLCWLILSLSVLKYLPCRNCRGMGGSPRLLVSAFVPSWQPTSTLWKIRQAAAPAGTVKTSKLYDFYAQNARQMSRKSADLVDDVAKTMELCDEPFVLQPATKDTSTILLHSLAKAQRLDSTTVLRTLLVSVSMVCGLFNQPAHAILSNGGHQEALLPPALILIPLQDASTIVLAFFDSPYGPIVDYPVYVGALGLAAIVGVGLARIYTWLVSWEGPTFDVSQWKDARATLFPVGVSTLCLSVAVWNSSNGDASNDAFRLFSPSAPVLSKASSTAAKSAARIALRLLNQKSQIYAACLSSHYARDDDRSTSRQFNQWAVEVDQKGSDIARRNAKNRKKSPFGTRPALGRSYTGSSSNDVDAVTVVSLIWWVNRNLKSCKVQSIKDVEKILTDIVVDANDGDCVIRTVVTTIKGVSRDDLLEDFPEMTIV